MQALARVLDPEFGISVVDLGLIYDVGIMTDCIHISMTLTTTHCPAGEVIMDGVSAAAQEVAAGRRVEVELVWDPQWTPDMLTAAARVQLGWAE